MVVVPPETPVTKPVELIVAIDGLEDVQGPVAAVVEPVNCEVNPTHENRFPVIVGEGLIKSFISCRCSTFILTDK
jgi:hypothetical protein